MFINIITPCVRKENLKHISQSISIPTDRYKWYVVFDSENIPDGIPDNCIPYAVKVDGSTSGNGQRNHALDLITSGYVYFNDDDTIIHPDFWEAVKDCTEDFISFKQVNKDGSLRLHGNNVSRNHIDSHNFLLTRDLIGDVRWVIHEYSADGIFAEECYKKASTKLYIPKVLSTYNSLR